MKSDTMQKPLSPRVKTKPLAKPLYTISSKSTLKKILYKCRLSDIKQKKYLKKQPENYAKRHLKFFENNNSEKKISLSLIFD